MNEIDRIKRLQEAVVELGLGARTIVSSTPKTVIDAAEHQVDDDEVAAFNALVKDSSILEVTKDLFSSGFYNLAVAEAFKAVEKMVAERLGEFSQSGTKLMRQAFSNKSPKLAWTERSTSSQKDEQEGYEHIFAGSMLGIRNPTTHEFDWVDDAQTALELVLFAQHLARKAKNSFRA
ncbi:TIGR02391 family protein [Ruegeria profundi]|uniref:TIGR02391 family protein n=1 Tax=Ruegeria profundi TaxID=1685378 RepID=UPI001CD428FE|nr:TIGR02391 family protein [Ruegeria profundi]MCA0927521.1 TIGR02391 family protein [Ruegeria profundi]